MLSVAHSLFSKESMTNFVQAHYDLPVPLSCQLLCMGDKDHYLVTANSERYVLRLYKSENVFKTESNYLFELDWLKYLQEKRCGVSIPMAQKDGRFLGKIEAPEGPRHYILFRFAEGDAKLNLKRAFLLGKEIARIHLISNKFQTSHEKLPLDLHSLLETPVQVIKQALGSHYVEEQERLESLATSLKEKILSLLSFKEKDWGLIGGDFNGANQHFVGNHRVTLFDFDVCSYGWRAYDLATFRWLQFSDCMVGAYFIQTLLNGRFLLWQRFLAGYQSIRPLSPAEKVAIPLFVQIKQIGWMSACIQYANPFRILDQVFWEKNFRRLFKKFQ